MAEVITDFQIEGFTLLRILSDRERSKVWLAKDASGVLCALKLQLRRDPSAALPGILARYRRLQLLTTPESSLLSLLAYGSTQNGWSWESLPLADNLPGLAAPDEEAGIQQYTPLTLRASSTENGPTPAKQVAEWGIRLAGALSTLHSAGLVHRDVKPTNIVFVNGKPCLGDYGLLGEPGSEIDFSGTEGFQPVEGTSDTAADLFALGKTLYEAWTRSDRLEFPSVPRSVLDAPDWEPSGNLLNEILLRACHAQPRKRFGSAAEFARALSNVLSGQRPINRRRWLAAATGVAVTAGAVTLPRWLRAPAQANWRRLRTKPFAVEAWDGHAGTVDWNRRRMYSLGGYKAECLFQSLDLDSFVVSEKTIPGGPKENGTSILHPETGQLWAVETGDGDVFALDLATEKITCLGGGPYRQRHYNARTYWNPLTRRVGVFGGYGWKAVRNDRSEFDEASRSWVKMDPNPELWPREARIPLLADSTGRRIFLLGGEGSPSGVQGERVPGLRGFDGQFHSLDDIWELNLEQSSWRMLLPLGHLDPPRLRAAVYHPVLQGLVIFEGMLAEDPTPKPAVVSLFRPGIDRSPVKLPVHGEVSCLPASGTWCILDPESNDVLLLAADGIFSVSIQRI